jgi:hypothetical protein
VNERSFVQVIENYLNESGDFKYVFTKNYFAVLPLWPAMTKVDNHLDSTKCYKKIAAYESEIRFDPNIPDLGDLAIHYVNVSVYKLFKLFYTIHYDILCSISMTNKILLMSHEYGCATM